ncbi:hypothetical protein GCM10023322_35320 [Rugosimonospora acidiphila]|uniref:HTH marR-type domain-containing protein n=2 Tax=Rugosimonospora acidiphila TaxID=556531 RepID=A0ABP9RU79_9ACTN
MVLRGWEVEVDEVLNGMPGGSRGYHLLTTVVHDGPPTQSALAERVAIDRTILTYLIDDLAEAGLVERRLDPNDRRARRVVATERGRSVLAEAQSRVSAVEDRLLAGISPTERDQFRDAAQRAARRIHETAPGTDPCAAVRSVLDAPTGPGRGSPDGGAREPRGRGAPGSAGAA